MRTQVGIVGGGPAGRLRSPLVHPGGVSSLVVGRRSRDGRGHRIDFADLTDGLSITIYGQQEVVKDLIQARLETDGQILFEAEAASVKDLETESPTVYFHRDGVEEEISCDFVAGCDGF